jgi:hypothetical protein
MAGTPPANTGKCANAALNTTLEHALRAPSDKKIRADTGKECCGVKFMGVLSKNNKAHWSMALCQALDLDQGFREPFGAQ